MAPCGFVDALRAPTNRTGTAATKCFEVVCRVSGACRRPSQQELKEKGDPQIPLGVLLRGPAFASAHPRMAMRRSRTVRQALPTVLYLKPSRPSTSLPSEKDILIIRMHVCFASTPEFIHDTVLGARLGDSWQRPELPSVLRCRYLWTTARATRRVRSRQRATSRAKHHRLIRRTSR